MTTNSQAEIKMLTTPTMMFDEDLIYVKPFYCHYICYGGFRGGMVVNNPPANGRDARETGSIPESGRSPGVGNDNSLQYSCLGNRMGRGA